MNKFSSSVKNGFFLYFLIVLSSNLFYFSTRNIGLSRLIRVLIIQYFFYLLIPITCLMLNKKIIKKDLRLNKINWKQFRLIFLISILAVPISTYLNNVVLVVLSLFGDYTRIQRLITDVTSFYTLIASIFIFVITPAICEETMFRGFLMNEFKSIGVRKSIILTAVLFSIFHLDIEFLLGATFIGIIFGYLVHITNSLYAGIIAHGIFNLTGSLLKFLLLNGSSDIAGDIVIWKEIIPVILLGIMPSCVFVALSWLLIKKLIETVNNTPQNFEVE
ncbi:Abortive infection protein [Alkaliphilus metalliredigens QYMF]|uniref:Abortive infection protein n=1 Tax=Alkaliphilus metalliredigens (strain QYMF) TaxID=293826 RepID=A6TM34_ALKMQ|nr:type II CAAX endopeptidase family protein [Alkaliphilus metalliredigens]ABR47252.1 Abortive infection protein [Alkaliphilus metalliredigens QYMF]